MIEEKELVGIGKIGKPHGIHGEINVYLDEDVIADRLEKLVMNIDGIFVPFFIESIRPKRVDTVIMALDGIDTEQKAAELTNHEVYALISDDVKEQPDEDGMYASDLIGYTIVHVNGQPIGEITGVEDSTENALFLVKAQNESTVYIPIADDLIDEIDRDRKIVVMTIPEGLLDL